MIGDPIIYVFSKRMESINISNLFNDSTNIWMDGWVVLRGGLMKQDMQDAFFVV